MRSHECPFEAEVLAAVLEARWPECADPELVNHAATCAICSDVAGIATAMEASRQATAPPVIPDSGRAWWLAQRRARLEAAEAANRPMIAARVLALVCVLALLCTYWRTLAAGFQAALERIDWADAIRPFAEHAGLALAMAVVVLLVPAAAWLAMGRK